LKKGRFDGGGRFIGEIARSASELAD